MKKGIKRLILALVTIACLFGSAYISIWKFSASNVENRRQNREELVLSKEQVGLNEESWHSEGEVYIAVDESATIDLQFESPVYIHNLLIDGTVSTENLSAMPIVYTDEGGQVLTDVASVEIKNDDIYVVIDRSVRDIRLGFQDAVQTQVELNGIVVNPHKINADIRAGILFFVTPLILVWFALDVICEKDAYKKMFFSLKKYRNLLWDLVSRDVKTKYRRSVLGILWSVLNPLLMMLVLTAIFKNIFRFEIQDFPVYYLTGYILFTFVSESTSFSMTSILGAAGLIKKVFIPKILFPLQKCLFSLVNLGFSLIAAVIVFVILGVEPRWTLLLFWVPIVYLFIFNFGFSLILATLNTFFRDVGYLYTVLLTVWMYLTPIIYPINILPGWMQSIVRLNPLYYYVEYFRAVTLYGTLPSLSDNLICAAFSVIFLLLGILVFQKNQNKFIFHI